MKIYVASSWRNPIQPSIVEFLRKLGHDVYDFRNPLSYPSAWRPAMMSSNLDTFRNWTDKDDQGFSWSDVDPAWKSWDVEGFKKGLTHPIALEGFQKDMHALATCDLCVLVLPCGKSAHLEAGWAARDDDKNVIVFIPKLDEAELMYLMLGPIVETTEQLAQEIEALEKSPRKVISFEEHLGASCSPEESKRRSGEAADAPEMMHPPCYCAETSTRNCPRHQNGDDGEK